MAESQRPQSTRCFVAIELPPTIVAELSKCIADLSRHGADVRWGRSEALHVTLRFLGDVANERLESVHAAVSSASSSHAAFTLEAHGVGGFPSLARPRVLWAGLSAAGLVELTRDIDWALAQLGFASEDRPFHPHVTLGRVRSPAGAKNLAAALDKYLDVTFGRCTIESVVVFRSTLRPDGSLYTPLWRVPLKNGER